MAKRKDNSWENNFGIPIESQIEIPENEMKEYLKSMQLQSESVQGWVKATLDQSEAVKQGYNQVLIQKDQEGKLAQRIAVKMNQNGKIEEKIFRETRTSYNNIKNNMIKEMQGIQKDIYQNGQMVSSTFHDFMGRDIIPKNINKNTNYDTKKSMKDKVLFERDKRLSEIRKEFDGSNVPHTDARGIITNPSDAAVVSWYKHQEGLTKKQLDAAIARINQRYNNSFKALKKTFDSSTLPGEIMSDGRFSEVAIGKDGNKRYMTSEIDKINAIRDQAISEVEKIHNNTPSNYVPKFKNPEAHQKYLEKRVLRETQNMMSGINSGSITGNNFELALDKFVNVNDFVESFKPIAATFSNINKEIYSGLLEQGKTQLVSNMKNGVFSLGGGGFNGSKFDTSKIIKQIIDKTQIGKDKVIDNPQKANEIMSAINKKIEERIKTGATSKDKATAFTGTNFLNNAYIDKNISSIAKSNIPLTYFDFETVGPKEGRGFQPTQLSVRNGDKSFNSIIKLNNDSIDYINDIFKTIKNGTRSLTDDEYRTITDLADYSIDATNPNKISAFHKKIKKGLNFNLSENQAIFNQIKEGFNILQGLTPDGKEAAYTNLYNTLDDAMNVLPQDFKDSTWVAHNGRNFDTEVFRHLGVNFNNKLLDTLELSKGLYAYGQKRYYDKNTGKLLNEKPSDPNSVITKTLKGYTLDNLADFFNIDLKMGGINQHTSEYDTELNRRIADQMFADISGGKATEHRLKGPLVGKTPVSVPVGSIGIAGKTKIRDHRDSFKIDASGKLLRSEDNSFNDIQFRKNGIYSYDGFFEFENGSKYAKFTDQETGQQVLEAYRDYEELNKNLTKHFDGKFSTMDSISSEASAFSSIFKKDTGIHNLRALGQLIRNKDDNTVTSGQKVRFSAIKKDSIKNVISSLDEMFSKSTMSDAEKSLVLSNIGKQMGINSTSMFTDNDIRKQIDDSSSGSLSSVRNAYIRYMNENKEHFKDSGVYNSILSSLKTATTSDLDGEVNAGSGDFYGISRRIYDAFDINYLESLQNTPKIPQHIFVNKFTEAATKAMESAKMQFSSANKSSVVDTIFNNADDNVKNAMSGKHIINRLKKIHNIRNDNDSPLMRDIEKLTGTIANNQGFDNQSVGGMLKAIEKQASAAGLGFGLKLNPDGSGLGMQIFNNSDMEANEDGSFFVPKSKSLSMMIPLDSGNGIINHNGMELTNFLIPEMNDGQLRINTSTESIVRHLQSVLANPKLKIFDKMKNGNVGYGQSILNSVVKNALDINPSAGTYKVSSMSDLYDTYKAGGSSVARAAKMGHGLYTNFFENIFQRYAKDDPELNNMNDFQKHQAIEQIRSWYSAVSFNKGDIPENDPKYDWLLQKNPTAKQYTLNQFDALKSVMPVDLTAIKESGFDSNVIGSMSANRFSLFGGWAPQEWRGMNQGTNIIGGVGNASEESMQELNIERDIFETRVGQSLGVDYSAKARPQIFTGLLSEKQMYEGYNAYIDHLKEMDKKDGGHRYMEFYNKYGSFAPSLFEGSFVMGENLMKETKGIRGQVVSVDSLDELRNSFKNLPITANGKLWTNLISKDGDKITLGKDGNGYVFEKDIDVTLDKSFSKGDILRSIEKKDGKYLLSFDENIQAHRGSKFVGVGGPRMVEDTGGMPEDFMDFMRKRYNLDSRVQQFMPQIDKLRDRDIPMYVGSRYQYLLNEVLKRNPNMSVDDINNKLSELGNNGITAGKFLKTGINKDGKISFIDNIEYDRASSSWIDDNGNKVFNTQDEFNNFMNTEKEGSDFEKLAESFLGNNWRDIIKDNTILTNTSLANEYEYFQAFGSGLDDMLSADGRVKMSIKEKDSIDRKLGLYSRRSGDYNNLSKLLHQYVGNESESYKNAAELAESYKTMGSDFFEVNKGGNLRSAKEWIANQGNVLKIVRRTSESQTLADNEIDIDDLARGAEWVKEAKGISLENWKETAAGMIHTKGTEAFGGQPFKVAMMLENPDDPSKGDYFSTTMPGDDLFDNVKGVSTLMFNPVGPNIIKDGIVSPTEDDYLLRDIFRSASTKNRNENNQTWLDDTTKAYSKYHRYAFDQVYHKDSPLFKLLHTNKVANATATKLTGLNAYEYDNLLKQTQSKDAQIRNKAQSKFNTMANTLFLNEDHVRDILSVEEGSDIDTYKKHFENLSRMYNEMYEEDNTSVDDLLSGKEFGDNIKGYKNRISSILDQIVKDITVDENGVARKSLTGFLHRYPSTSGLDEILANINIDKGLPKGVSSLGIGLATRMNADWDGDVIRAAIPWLKNNVDLETFKKAYKEAEYIKSKENEVSKMVAERRASKENFNASKQDLQDADMWTSLMDKVVHNKDTSDFAGIVAKNNFDFIGQFSTFATSIRGALKEAQLDEINPNLSDSEKMQAMAVRAVFESIEQDAISSKKVVSRLMKNARAKLGNDATSEQLQTHIMSEMQNLVSLLYGHDQDGKKISDKQKMVDGLSLRMDKAFSYGKEIGLFGEGKEFLDGRQAWTAIAQMYHMGKTSEQQDSIRKMMYKNGLITQDHKIGTLSEDFVRKSLGDIEQKVESRYPGKNLYTLGKEYRNNVAGALSYDFYGRKMAEMAKTLGLSGNDEVSAKDSHPQSIQQIIGQGLSGTNLGNVNIEAISAFIQALGLATQGVQSFTGAVTGDLSAIRRDPVYVQTLSSTKESQGLGIAELDPVSHTYSTGIGNNRKSHYREINLPVEERKTVSVTEIANALFGKEYEDPTPEMTKLVNDFFEKGYVEIDGKKYEKSLTDLIEAKKGKGKEANGLIARYTKGQYSTIQGSMTHKALEILRDNKIDNADILFGDGKNLEGAELSAYNAWQKFLTDSEGSTYQRQLKQMGKEFNPDAAKLMAKQGFLGLKDGGISELSLGMKVGEHEIFGTLDAFINGKLFDYKTTEGMHPDQMGFQLGMLKRLILENGDLLVSDDRTKEAFKMYRREDGTFDVAKFSNPENFKSFIAQYDKDGSFAFHEMHIPEGNELNTLLADFYSGAYKTQPLLWQGFIKNTFGHTGANKEAAKLSEQKSVLKSMMDERVINNFDDAKKYIGLRNEAQKTINSLIGSGFNYKQAGERIKEIEQILSMSKQANASLPEFSSITPEQAARIIINREEQRRATGKKPKLNKKERQNILAGIGLSAEEYATARYGSNLDELKKEYDGLVEQKAQFKSAKNTIKDANKFFAERDGLEGYTLLQNAQNALFKLEEQHGINALKNQLEDENLSEEERNKLQKRLEAKNKRVQADWKKTFEYSAFEQYKESHPSFDSTMSAYKAKQSQQEAMAQEYINLELAQQAVKGMYGVDSEEYKKATEDLNRFTSSFATRDLGFFAEIQALAESYKDTDEYKEMEEKAYANTAKDYAKGLSKDKSAESQKSALKAYEQSRNKEVSLDKQLKYYQELQMTTSKGSAEWEKIQTIISSITAQLQSQEGITANIANNYLTGVSQAEKGIIDKNTESKKETNENVHAYKQEKIASRQEATSFKEDMKNANQYYKEMTKINEDIAKLQGKANKSRGKTKEHYLNEIAQKEAYRKNIEGVYADRGIYYTYDAETGTGTFKNAKGEITSQTTNKAQAEAYYRDYTAMNLRYNERLRTTQAESQRVGFFDKMKGSIKGAAEYMMFTSLGYSIIGSIRGEITKIIQQTRQLEKTMTDLRIVTGGSEDDVQSLMYSYQQLGSQLGLTTAEVSASANEWLRMGYNAEQANTMIYNSAMLAKLGMIDTAKATEYMVSAVKGYNVAIQDAEKIVDMATSLDMKYAVSAGYILEAMARTASGAKLAKVEMSELQSLIAVIGETTQKDASVIGESLKTAFSRYANVKATAFVKNPNLSGDENLMNQYALETEASESGDATAVNDIEKVLKVVDIDIRNGEEWRSYSDILKELGEGWKTYSDYEKNAIVTAMFGTRQRENGIVALTNYNRVLEANEVAINSVGTATQKMEIYSQGLEAAQNRVTAAWEKLVMDLEAGGVIQKTSEMIKSLIENFEWLAVVIGGGLLLANLDKVFVALTRFSVLFNSKMAMGASLGKGFFTGDFSGFKEKMSNAIDKSNKIAEDGKVDIDSIRNNKTKEFNNTITVTIDELKNFGRVINKLNNSLGKNSSETDKNTNAKQNEATASQQATTADVNEATASQQATTADVNEATASQQATVTRLGGGRYLINPNNTTNTHYLPYERQLNMNSPRTGTFLTPKGISNSKNIKTLMNKSSSTPTNSPKITSTTGVQIGSMFTGMVGMIGGSGLGSKIAEEAGLDETGQMMGSVIGGGLVSTISSSLMMSGNPHAMIGGAALSLGSMIGSWIWGAVKKKKENALKELTKDLAEVEERYNNLTSIDTEDKVAKWDELSQGVNSFGENVSLTNAQYEEYLSLSNEIGEMFPDLISRTDAFGNSIITVGDDVNTLTERLKKMQEQTRDETIDAYFREKDGVSNASQVFDDFKEKTDGYRASFGNNKYAIDDILSYDADPNLIVKLSDEYFPKDMKEKYEEEWKKRVFGENYRKELTEEKLKKIDNTYTWKQYSSKKETDLTSLGSDGASFYNEVKKDVQKIVFNDYEKYKKSEMVKDTADYRSKLIEDVIGFKDLGGELSSFLMNLTAGVDVTQFENEEDYQNFLKDNIINLYKDSSDDIKNSFNTLKKNEDNEVISLSELSTQYDKNIDKVKTNIEAHIESMDDTKKTEFYKKYGLTYSKEDGKIRNAIGEEVSQEKFLEQFTGFQNVGKNQIETLGKKLFKDFNVNDTHKKLNRYLGGLSQSESKFLNNLSSDTLNKIINDTSLGDNWEDRLQSYLDKHFVSTAFSAKSNLETLVKGNKAAEDALSKLFEDYNQGNVQDLLNILNPNSTEGKKALKYIEDMKKRANSLGMSFEDVVEKASALSHIDIYGRSSKTVTRAYNDGSKIQEWKNAVLSGTLSPEQFEEMALEVPSAAAQTNPEEIAKELDKSYIGAQDMVSAIISQYSSNDAFYQRYINSSQNTTGLTDDLIKNIDSGLKMKEAFELGLSDESLDTKELAAGIKTLLGEDDLENDEAIEKFQELYNVEHLSEDELAKFVTQQILNFINSGALWDGPKSFLHIEASKGASNISGKESADKAYRELKFAQRDFERATEDHYENLEEIAKKKRLNDLEKELSEKSGMIQRFTNEISNYDWGLELLPEIDYEGRIDILGDKISSLASKNAELKRQMSEVASKTPESAEEAQKLKETYDSLYSALQENQKSIISVKKELNSLTVDALMSPFNEAVKLFEKQKSILDSATSIMTGSVDVEGSWKLMSFEGLYDFTEQSELEKKREEYELLLKEQESYQNKSLQMEEEYQSLRHQETLDDLVKEEKRAVEDFEKTADDYRKQLESFLTEHSSYLTQVYGSTLAARQALEQEFSTDALDLTGKLGTLKGYLSDLNNLSLPQIKQNADGSYTIIPVDTTDVDTTNSPKNIDEVPEYKQFEKAINSYKNADTAKDKLNYLQDIDDTYSVLTSGKYSGYYGINNMMDEYKNTIGMNYMNPQKMQSIIKTAENREDMDDPTNERRVSELFVEINKAMNDNRWDDAKTYIEDVKEIIEGKHILRDFAMYARTQLNKYMRIYNDTKPESVTHGFELYTYAKGTGSHQGGLALVGDENLLEGSNKPSPELAIYPNGQVEIVGQDGAEIRNLPKGTQVIPTYKTEDLLGNIISYANGTNNSVNVETNTEIPIEDLDEENISKDVLQTFENVSKIVDEESQKKEQYQLNTFPLEKKEWDEKLPKTMNEKVDEAIDDVNGQDRTFVAPTPDEMTWTNFGTRIGEYISNGIVNGVENGEYAVATSNPFNFNIPLKGWNSSSDAINPNMSSIQKGQTLYFHSKSSPLYGHVGIYDGNGGVYHRAGGNGYSYTPFSEMVSGSNYTYVGAGWNGGSPLTTNQADALIENIKANKVADPGQGYCQKWVASAYQTVTGKYRSILSPENAIRAGWVTSTESPLFKALYASQQQENKNGLLLLIQNAMQNYGLGQNLGWLSQMYEGNVGTIANNAGDFGGKSYGIPQFSLRQGSLQSFVNWLSSKDAKFAKPLTDTLLGTSGFDAMWKQIAKEQPDKFARYQQEYAYNTMAIPQAKKIYDKYGIDMTRSAMLREALISMAYQYNNLSSSLLNGATKDMSDLELIELIYANKAKNVGSHFRSSSQGIRNAISNRIINEKSTLLNAYSYAYGTTGHPGGLALIGDENLLEGSNKPSPELAIYPNGQVEIVGQDGAEIRDLPKGTQIIPTDKTESLFDVPNYANGIDSFVFSNDLYEKIGKNIGNYIEPNIVRKIFNSVKDSIKTNNDTRFDKGIKDLQSYFNDYIKLKIMTKEESNQIINRLYGFKNANVGPQPVITKIEETKTEENKKEESTKKTTKNNIKVDSNKTKKTTKNNTNVNSNKTKKTTKNNTNVNSNETNKTSERLKNIEDLQKTLIISGQDIGDILKKTDEEIFNQTGLNREQVKETKNTKQAIIDNLVKNTTDWDTLFANNNTGLSEQDLKYAKRLQDMQKIDKIVPSYLKNISELFNDDKYKNLVLSYQNINTSKLNRQQQKEHVLEEYDERILNETNPFKKQDLKNYQALFSKEDEVLYDMQTLNTHMNMRDYMIDFYRSHIEQWQEDGDYDTINKFQEAISDVTEKIESMQKSVEEYVEEMYEISALTYNMRERYREHNAQMLADAYEFGQIGVKTEENYFAELKADAATSTESARVAFEDAKAALYKQVIVENGGSYEDFLAEMKTNETIQKAQQEINNSIKNEKQVRQDEFDYFIENLERAFNELEVSIGMIANKTTDLLRVSLLTDESSKAMTALSKIDEIRIRLQDPYLSESQQRDYQKQINEQNNIIFESIDEYLSGRLQNANTIATNTINQLTSADSAGVITGINKYKRRNGDFRQAINSNFYETQIEAYEEERETIVQTLVDREAELSKMAEEKGVSVEELKAVDSIWNEGIESYYQSLINVQEKLREELDAKLELIDMDQKILDLNKQQEWSSIRNIENYYGETQANLQAKRAELIDYMEMTEISYEEYLAKKQELADINKQIIDSSLEELQAKQSFYNEQYGAMTFMVNEYTDALNDEKERVSDYYDEEIRKLQQVNDSKERSIKLTELQNNLDNAKKEKKRVYRAGIGFVYEEDRDAVKKAEDELDAFYRQDQLDSLNDAKDMELKILDDRIEGWNKYLEAIEKVYKTAERHHNMELLKTMFGIEGEVNWDNIFEFLNSDMGSYLTEDKLGEHIYYGELTSWLRTYTGVSEDIYDEVSAIHDVLWNLPEYNGSNEDHDDAMYGKETSKELKLLDAINYEEYNFKQMLDSANNKYWRDVVAEHPEITDFSALTDEELEKYGLNSNEAKALHNQKLIEMSEFVREGNVLDRNGNIVGYDDSYKDIAAILDGSNRNTTNWSFEELQQARYLKLKLQKNSGEITEEQYKELYKPVEYSNENFENFLNNPANQIMTKNDLISALKETYQMSDNTILNILLKYFPIISKDVEGPGEIIFKNIEKLQNELISSGKDIGDILKKSDTEIFAETGLKREYVEEARRIKQEKINNLVDTIDDWENLKANNNTGLSMNDIIYAERLQKNNINSHISETGDVAKNQQLVKNNKPIEVNGTSLIDFDIDSTGKITNGYLENLSKNSDEQTELMRASLGITHGMMSPIEVVSKNDMYLSMSQNPTVSKEVTPIDFKGVKFGIANSSLMDYPKITSLLANNKENITNNNGNINVFVSKGTNLPAIQYASTLEHTNKQDNLV